MAKKMLTRVQNKHDIEANWKQAVNFTPLVGEIIVYDKDENFDYQRIKIGDGIHTVNSLPFMDDNFKSELENLELITINDIDTICGATISYVSLDEGAF